MLANFSNLITFSRGSNATVTDASGRLTYAPHNLLTNSETFEATSSWLVGTNTITANTIAAPNGSVTADTFTATATGSGAFVRQIQTAAASTRHIVSVYFKRGTADFANITVFDGTNGNRYWFNLVNGTVASTAVVGAGYTGLSAAIQDAGNGWYRCSVTFTNGSTTTFNLFATFTNADASLDVTSGRTGYLWGAQLEAVTYQTTPSPYVSTSVANLLGFSEAFDNAAWTKSNSSIVPNAAQNPINNLWNAQKLMENTSASTHYALQAATVTASPYTLSVYAKAGERAFVSLGFDGLNAWFNLSTGAVGTVEAGLTASITPIGGGWYRCAVFRTVTSAGSKSCAVYAANANNVVSYTGDGNSGIYIYGAQLSNSGSLDPYVPTPGAAPSSTAYYGPRFDYDPVTLASKGILIEEQRTNLLRYSEQLDNGSAWTNVAGATVTANTFTAPDGTTTADTVNFSTTNANRVEQSFGTAVNGETMTFSVYLRGSGSMAINIGTDTGVGGNSEVIVNLTSTWTRYSATVTYSSPTGLRRAMLIWRTGNTATSAQAWGAQVEAAAFATSYIPTVASQVTRTADVASITGSLFNGWYNQDQGTITFKGTSLTVSGFSYAALANDTTNNNRFGMYRSSAVFSGLVVSGGVTQMDIAASSATANVPFKMATTAQANNGNFCFNNVLGTTDTSVTMPTVTRLDIGCFGSGSQFNGHIQNITYIPNRVSDTQLQSATT